MIRQTQQEREWIEEQNYHQMPLLLIETHMDLIDEKAPSPASTGETNHSRNESNVSDKEIEHEIVEKGLTAPRVTPEQIEKVIVKEEFFRLTGVLTVCVLTLANGFTVTGESACASPENFNEEIGNKIARENAKQKIWPLEGYLLKQRLAATPREGERPDSRGAARTYSSASMDMDNAP